MRRRCFPVFLICLALLLTAFSAGAETVEPWSREHPEVLYAAHLKSQSAILVDGETGEVLFEKNAHERMYPASTTKVMTLLLALESGISLNETVTIPSAAGDYPEGSSVVPVYPGEEMTFRDLLYGFMMRSGNDGANAIAVLVSGSIPDFVAAMNARAEALGCEGTHFVNAHGYHDQDHYTTAADLALIAREAMLNPDFRRIVATAKYTMAATARRGELEITTRNELLVPDSRYYYPDCVGIKTGFHSRAGQCLVGGAIRDSKLLISVALNSDGQDETLKWYDTAMLFEYGYTQYEQCGIAELAAALPELPVTVTVNNAAADDPEGGSVALRLEGFSDGNAQVSVRKRDGARAEAMQRLWKNATVELSEDVAAPVAEGQTLGRFECTLPSGATISANLTAARAVAAQPDPTPVAVKAEPTPTSAPQPVAVERSSSGLQRLEKILIVIGILAAIAVAVLAALLAQEKADRKKAAQRKRAAKKKKQ